MHLWGPYAQKFITDHAVRTKVYYGPCHTHKSLLWSESNPLQDHAIRTKVYYGPCHRRHNNIAWQHCMTQKIYFIFVKNFKICFWRNTLKNFQIHGVHTNKKFRRSSTESVGWQHFKPNLRRALSKNFLDVIFLTPYGVNGCKIFRRSTA